MTSNKKDVKSDMKTDKVHLLLALRRKKDNEHLRGEPQLCFRTVLRNKVDHIQLMARTTAYPGKWRIYQTMNARCVVTARKKLMKMLIDDPENQDYRIDSTWKTCLLQAESKAEKKFLMDIDTKDPETIKNVGLHVIDKGGMIIYQTETPHGHHMVVTKFDTRDFNEKFPDNVEFKRDGYVHISAYEVDKEGNIK